MTADTKINVKQVFPILRYQDPAAAIDWMVEVLGMEKWAVFKNEGAIVHAELKFGDVFVQLGPTVAGAKATELEGTYTAIDNPDAFYQRVTSKGAKITRELEDTDYGSREFALVDPEGRGWSFGTWTHSPEPHIE